MNFSYAEKMKYNVWMSESQIKWIDIQKMIVKAQINYETANIPTNKLRKKIFDIVRSTWFQLIIMICIILNMFQMSMLYHTASDEFIEGLEILNLIFTGIFLVEAILKIGAYGKAYFYDSWNVFDFLVVGASLIDIVLTFTDSATLKFLRVGPQLVRVLRVLRVSR